MNVTGKSGVWRLGSGPFCSVPVHVLIWGVEGSSKAALNHQCSHIPCSKLMAWFLGHGSCYQEMLLPIFLLETGILSFCLPKKATTVCKTGNLYRGKRVRIPHCQLWNWLCTKWFFLGTAQLGRTLFSAFEGLIRNYFPWGDSLTLFHKAVSGEWEDTENGSPDEFLPC